MFAANLSFKQSFSLIEMIIVIILLGIISAVAIPRFINFNIQPEMELMRQTYTNMQSAIEIIKQKWRIAGQPSYMSLHCTASNEYDIHISSSGNIDGAQSCSTTIPTVADSLADCATIFNTIVSNISSAAAANSSACSNSGKTYCAEQFNTTCQFRPRGKYYMTTYFRYNYGSGTFSIDSTP